MSFAGLSLDTAMRRTWSASEMLAGFLVGSRDLGRTYLFPAFAHGVDARGYAGDVFGELLRALGIYLHVFGHGWNGAMMVFACSALRLASVKTSDRRLGVISEDARVTVGSTKKLTLVKLYLDHYPRGNYMASKL